MKTALVTGGTGYIGSWVVNYLLAAGYQVKAAARNPDNKTKTAPLEEIAAKHPGKLEFFKADLLQEGSFDAAMQGVDEVYHLASPFILSGIKDAQKQLVDPALQGTRNVLRAANKSDSVKRIILTSSVVAIYGDAKDMQDMGLKQFTEEHWNTSSSVDHQPYPYSKTLAEKEAWKIAEAQDQWELSVINPGFVMGPSLVESSDSASLSFMQDLISGQQRLGAPMLEFGWVDVRDVARAHLLAAEKSANGRHILVNECKTILEIARILKGAFGKKYALPSGTLPKFMVLLFGWTEGLTWKYIMNNVGYPLKFDNSRSKENLGMQYRPLRETLVEMVESMG